MHAYGLSAPPRPRQGESVNLTTNATTALPALAGGAPWIYAMVSTPAALAYFVAGDSTVDSATLAHIALGVSTGPVIMNLAGKTHVDRLSGDVLVTPIDAPRGEGNMLRSPPQLAPTALNQSMAAAATVAIPSEGSHPTKYIMLTSDSTTATRIAVGDSTVTAAADGQLWMNINSGPVFLNVSQMTHLAFSTTGGAFLQVALLSF